ncbi:MAG: RusA family crossover junction endodeoxyribonuclease [Planctomycetaceae bacterium]
MRLRFDLPYPPSVNHYWRRVGARTLISRQGRAFRDSVCSLLALRRLHPLEGWLKVHLQFFPPDRRRRDVDNIQKPVLDALQHAGVYHDDFQIVSLVTDRLEPREGGQLVVAVTQVTDLPTPIDPELPLESR